THQLRSPATAPAARPDKPFGQRSRSTHAKERTMSTPFLGEIKIISWNYPPKGWAFTNGQFLPINQNQALFSLLGTTYGGNGQTTFALPDFRGRVPVHVGGDLNVQGQAGGESSHTVNSQEMPAHNHFMNV